MTSAHVFLTRFNLPSPGVESVIRAREGWLRERIELFETYTVPSVRAQGVEDVHWIVYCDTESPAWLLEKMEAWRAEGILTPLLRTSVSPEERANDIREVVGRSDGQVITSNLDNDDGLAKDFVQRLREAEVVGERNALYLGNGLITNGTRAFLREDRDNAFCAVREDLRDPVTCWADWHNRLHEHMPVVVVDGAPGWLQVIHGANVSNRVRGAMVDPGPYRTLFPGLLDGVQAPSAAEVARDRLVEAPKRFVRDQARSRLRDGLVRVVGKDGFDKAKFAAQRVVREGRSAAGKGVETVQQLRNRGN